MPLLLKPTWDQVQFFVLAENLGHQALASTCFSDAFLVISAYAYTPPIQKCRLVATGTTLSHVSLHVVPSYPRSPSHDISTLPLRLGQVQPSQGCFSGHSVPCLPFSHPYLRQVTSSLWFPQLVGLLSVRLFIKLFKCFSHLCMLCASGEKAVCSWGPSIVPGTH